MAQSDSVAQIAQYTAAAKSWEDRASATADPMLKSLYSANAQMAQEQAQMALQQLQHQIDSTNSFLDNMGLWNTIGQITSGLTQSLPTVINIFKR